MSRTGNYILTASGVRYYPLDPHPDDVRLEDAAHSLSQQCRFGGHTRKKDGSPRHYSVAEHAVYASFVVQAFGFDEHVQLRTLHHDSPEYVCVDLPRPIKKDPRMSFYGEVETLNMTAMEGPLKLRTHHAIVDAADELMLAIEMRDLMPFEASASQEHYSALIEKTRSELAAAVSTIESSRAVLLTFDMIDIGIERPFLPPTIHWKDAFLARDRAIRAAGTAEALLADRMIKLQPDTSKPFWAEDEMERRMRLGDTGPKRCHCEGRVVSCIDCDGKGWVR